MVKKLEKQINKIKKEEFDKLKKKNVLFRNNIKIKILLNSTSF